MEWQHAFLGLTPLQKRFNCETSHWLFFRLYGIYIHLSLGLTNAIWDHFGLLLGRTTPTESGQMTIILRLEIWNATQYFPVLSKGWQPDWFFGDPGSSQTVLADLLLFTWTIDESSQVYRTVIFLEISMSLDFNMERDLDKTFGHSAMHYVCL